MVEVISTLKAPKAIGPYSQAVVAAGFVFVSGQIPLDATTGQLTAASIAEQTKTVLTNLEAILEEAGSSMARVVKTTVYLTDMGNFDEMNQVYSQFFTSNKPARATVEVSRLPKGVAVEIDAIAVINSTT